MTRESEDEPVIRKYLLGQLSEDEQRDLEERIMVDSELFDQTLLTEDDLVEEYLDGQLTGADRDAFESHYLSTRDGRTQFNLAKSMREYVVDETARLKRADDSPQETSFAGDNGFETNQTPASHNAPPETESNRTRPHSIGALSAMPPGPTFTDRGLSQTQPAIQKSAKWWRGAGVSPFLRSAAAAALLVASGLILWWQFFYQSEIEKGLAQLANAYRVERPTEARISGFGYAPFLSTRRAGSADDGKVDRVARDDAAMLLFSANRRQPSAESYHALGMLYLSKGEVEEAIGQLDSAVGLDQGNARIYSDYGAALLQIGDLRKAAGELGRSFEEYSKSKALLDRALQLEPSLLEALFNRALCHERLDLRGQAIEDWNLYLEKDPNSGWAQEARQSLTRLQGSASPPSPDKDELLQSFLEARRDNDSGRAWTLISQNRNQTGSTIQSRLTDDCLDEKLEPQNHEWAERFAVLSYAGDVERLQGRDLFVSDLASYYKSASQGQRGKVREARGLLGKAQAKFADSDFDAGLDLCNSAKDMFRSAGNVVEALYVDNLIGGCYLQQFKAEAALEVFQTLAQSCEKANYKWRLARTLYQLSNANQHVRDFSTAIGNSTRAMQISEEIGDTIGMINARLQLADIYRFLNNPRKALDMFAHDLPIAGACMPQPANQWANYFSISRIFDQLNQGQTAIAFQKEALRLAIAANAPRMSCRSLNSLGLLLARNGDPVEASNNIERALEIAASLPPGRSRTEVTAYSYLQLGQIYRERGDSARAIESYDQAIRMYDEIESQFFSFSARKGRVLGCLELGTCPLVEQEMEALLTRFEEHRSKILEESNRNTFFDSEQSIYDVAIGYQYFKKGSAEKALEISERSRGRSLRDMMRSTVKVVDDPNDPDMKFENVGQPMTSEAILQNVPKDTQILQYAVLRDSILIWLISRDGIIGTSKSISSEDLNQAVDSFLRLCLSVSKNDASEFRRASVYLHDLLIKPVDDRLDGSKRLCIVPDKALNYIPFGALISESSGRYFIEERSFVLSPSASIFIASSEIALGKGAQRVETLCCVGDPRYDTASFPNLGSLRFADDEAREVARLYKCSGPLIGGAATESRVTAEMEKTDVIHLATHARADEWYPLRSMLLLAREADGRGPLSDGVLQAYEIYKLNLERARLVVLSACQTAVEKFYGGEGMIGLSRAFTAKRIPLVVASLWPVETESTADLMIAFHRHRKAGSGMTTVEALRSAQRDMIKAGVRPYYWAAFVVVGGDASF